MGAQTARGAVTPDQVSVVLPTYNEAGNIALLMRGILEALGPAVEIIVVDDASGDGTADVVRTFAQAHPQVRLVYRDNERGLTSAIWRGVTESDRPVVCWMDCDLSMPPADWPRILAALEGHDLALGSRYAPGGRDEGHGWLGRTLSQTICRLSRLLLGGRVLDFTSGFMAVRRPVLMELGLRGDYGEYCIDLIHRAQRRGYLAVEAPYVCAPRHSGESKTSVGIGGFLRRGPGYLAAVWRLWRNEGRVRG
ncbi:MAG: polyprenol monophosphomannose synthase [Thermodesulfobacteriota bacterium]